MSVLGTETSINSLFLYRYNILGTHAFIYICTDYIFVFLHSNLALQLFYTSYLNLLLVFLSQLIIIIINNIRKSSSSSSNSGSIVSIISISSSISMYEY